MSLAEKDKTELQIWAWAAFWMLFYLWFVLG